MSSYDPFAKNRKLVPGVNYYLPGQVGFELGMSERKRFKRHPEHIMECFAHFFYFWEILVSIVSDPTKSMKLPDELLFDRYTDLLFKGSTRDNPVDLLDKADLPGLSALLPVNPEGPDQTKKGTSVRNLKRFFVLEDGRTVRKARLKDSDWEAYAGQVIQELSVLTMEARTFLQSQLINDPKVDKSAWMFNPDYEGDSRAPG